MVSVTGKETRKETSGKSKKPPVFILIVAAFVLLVIGAFFIKGRGGSHTVDVSEYTTVTPEGFDGYGKIGVKVDEDSLKESLMSEKGDLEESAVNDFVYSLEVKPSASSDLSNGDEITMSLAYDKNVAEVNKIKVKSDEWKYTVADLKPITEINPFDYADVSYRGISPNGEAVYEAKHIPELDSILSYEFDKNTGLSVGDTITLRCTSNDEQLLSNGCVLSEKEKSLTVTDLDRYIEKVNDIDSGSLEIFKSKADAQVTPYVSRISNDEWRQMKGDNITYEGMCVLSWHNSEPPMWPNNMSEVVLVYSVDWTNTRPQDDVGYFEKTKLYMPVRFKNVVQYKDGKIDFEGDPEIACDGSNNTMAYYGNQQVNGYDDISRLFSDIARSRSDDYDYEADDLLNSKV